MGFQAPFEALDFTTGSSIRMNLDPIGAYRPCIGPIIASIPKALTFSVVDLVNYVLGFLQVSVAKPFVESAAQVYMVLACALIMGGLFGLIFGVMDVEDEVSYQIRLALLREERYCYPVGALLGGLASWRA